MKAVASLILAALLSATKASRLPGYTYPTPITAFLHSSSTSDRHRSVISTNQDSSLRGSLVSSGQTVRGSSALLAGNIGDSISTSSGNNNGFFISSGTNTRESTGGTFTLSGANPTGITSGSIISSGFATGSFSQSNAVSCAEGQVLHADGRCVTPEVTSKIYVYNVPQQHGTTGPRPDIPLPKLEHNILFVRLPENTGGQDPIIVPPPQQKDSVYVLKKETAIDGRNVINIPAPAKSQPEVFFVNYDEGQNPILPGGIDLQTALNSAVHQNVDQFIGGVSGETISIGSRGGIVSGEDILSGGSTGRIITGGSSGEILSGVSTSGISSSGTSGLNTFESTSNGHSIIGDVIGGVSIIDSGEGLFSGSASDIGSNVISTGSGTSIANIVSSIESSSSGISSGGIISGGSGLSSSETLSERFGSSSGGIISSGASGISLGGIISSGGFETSSSPSGLYGTPSK